MLHLYYNNINTILGKFFRDMVRETKLWQSLNVLYKYELWPTTKNKKLKYKPLRKRNYKIF